MEVYGAEEYKKNIKNRQPYPLKLDFASSETKLQDQVINQDSPKGLYRVSRILCFGIFKKSIIIQPSFL